MGDTLDIAAIQLNSQDDLEHNLATCKSWVRRASERGAKLVVLPENFAFFSADTGRRRVAESLSGEPGPIRRALAEWAREFSVTVIGGGFPEASPQADDRQHLWLTISHHARGAARCKVTARQPLKAQQRSHDRQSGRPCGPPAMAAGRAPFPR